MQNNNLVLWLISMTWYRLLLCNWYVYLLPKSEVYTGHTWATVDMRGGLKGLAWGGVEKGRGTGKNKAVKPNRYIAASSSNIII